MRSSGEAHAESESVLFLADAVFAVILERLSGCREPLLAFDDGRPIVAPGSAAAAPAEAFWERRLVVTDAGRAVLAGEIDHVAANGVERWLGGVHLDAASPWRWDPGADAVLMVA